MNQTPYTLRVFFKELHDKMNENLTEEFFLLESPWFPGISQSLYDEVLSNYKPHIVLSVNLHWAKTCNQPSNWEISCFLNYRKPLQDNEEITDCQKSLNLNFPYSDM